MKTILVDDNLMEIEALRNCCESWPEINLAGVFEDAQQAMSFLNKEEIDLMFLDVEMPEMTGLELIDNLSYLPQIVLTSSNREYAYEALEYEVTDFIKKPVLLKRFQKAMEKVEERHKRINEVALSSAATEELGTI
jgi:YesN/AraC family two-component response regulator